MRFGNTIFGMVVLAIGLLLFATPVQARFLQTDPIGTQDQMNLYGYVSNDPLNATDPTGEYERGTGFTDDQWKEFDGHQKQAALDTSKTVGELQGAAITLLKGGAIDSATQGIIDNFGQDVGLGKTNVETATRMLEASNSLAKTVEMLQDDGSKGYVANAKYDATAGAPAGMMQYNSKVMTVNTAHMNSGSYFKGTMIHESLHGGMGFADQLVNGVKAYACCDSAAKTLFRNLPTSHPSLAIKNPDSLSELVYPFFP